MLPPVQTSSGADLTLQSHAARVSAKGPGAGQAGRDLSSGLPSRDTASAIAARLNALLMASRQRMFESLLDAIDTAGRALSLRRDEGETDLAYATRLADTAQALPPARVAAADRLMRRQGQLLSLRTIVGAVLRPEGPDAARVMAFLETAKYRDRDLAARAVVRSYRQNEGSPLRAVEPARHSATAPLPPAAPETPAEPRPASRSGAVVPALVAPVDDEERDPAVRQVELAPRLPVRVEPARIVSGRAPSPSLQPAAAPASRPATEGGPRPTAEKPAAAVAPRGWAAVLGTMVEVASELVRTTLQTGHAVPRETDRPVSLLPPPQAEPSAPAETVEAKPHSAVVATAATPADGSDDAEIGNAAAQVARNFPEGAGRAPPAADAGAYVRPSASPTAGIAYAPLAYLPAKDAGGLDKSAEAERHGRHPRDDDEQPPQEQRGGRDEQGDPKAAGPAADGESNEEPVEVNAAATDADTAYALYRRLAGWE